MIEGHNLTGEARYRQCQIVYKRENYSGRATNNTGEDLEKLCGRLAEILLPEEAPWRYRYFDPGETRRIASKPRRPARTFPIPGPAGRGSLQPSPDRFASGNEDDFPA